MENEPWRFTQCFGDKVEGEQVTEADILTAVEFDYTGKYFATGDKGGRIVLFERMEGKEKVDYKFYCEFQSHEPEFDYLKSMEIEEKINRIRWLKRGNEAHFLLSTNDKTIKLWRIRERKEVSSTLKKVYGNAHAFHINSISVNSDQETFLSSDDLRINLWNLQDPTRSFNIVDIKPPNMEELSEVITTAEFHPTNCNIFMYSVSRGALRLADMRQSALCDVYSKVYQDPDDQMQKNFFTEIISSVTDLKFSPNGRYVATRDYMALKIWDLNMDRKPLKVVGIHHPLVTKLCELYESDHIFDKFDCSFSHDSQNVLSGSYGNFLQINSVKNQPTVHVQADKLAFKKKLGPKKGLNAQRKPVQEFQASDFQKKVKHLSFHPLESTIAVAATNNLFLFMN